MFMFFVYHLELAPGMILDFLQINLMFAVVCLSKHKN